MLILAVQLVMTAATLCFAAGLFFRHRNNPLHRKLMLAGFLFTIGIAVVLVVGVHVFELSYGPASWLLASLGSESAARGVLITHRLLATTTFLALLGQVVTGIRNHPAHHWLYKAAVPLWVASYLSGLFIFE